MPKKNEKALSVTSGASDAPAFLVPSQVGKALIDRADIQTPFIRVMQAQSPAVQDKKAKVGDFVNVLTGKNYGTELVFAVIGQAKGRIHFQKMEEGGGMLCRSTNGVHAEGLTGQDAEGKKTGVCADCVYSQWGEKANGKAKQPACQEQASYLVLPVGDTEPAILAFKSTGWKAHKRLATMIHMNQYAMFAPLYRATTVEQRFDVGSAAVIQIESAGYPEEEATYRRAEALHLSLGSQFKSSAPVDEERES